MNEEQNNMDSVSLDNRKIQLTQKVEQFGAAEPSKPISSPYDTQADQGTETNEPEVIQSDIPAEDVTENVSLPETNETPKTPSPQVGNMAAPGMANPYAGAVYADYTKGMKMPKQKLNSGLKVYLTVIIGLCVIFLGMFVFECVRAYNENGLFGGDLDRFLDTDYAFHYNIPNPYSSDSPFRDDDDSEDETESDTTDTDTDMSSDDGETVMKPAPKEEDLFSSEADKIQAKDQPSDIDSVNYSARTAYKKVENSVVNIVIYNGKVGDEDAKAGTGSGMILTEDGYIVTNSHVVNDSRNMPTEVILNDGESYIASIVGVDVRTDIAVLKIDADGLKPVEFVNSDQIEVGQDAIAVGSPGGVKYSNSLTKGCVSALNRTVKSNALVPYIQTDAAINPGNSGGPLLNSAGQVMGINTIKIANTDYEGMGFAIPSNTVLSIVRDIMKQGYVSGRVRIGITGSTVSDLTAPAGAPKGVLVIDLTDDSPLNGTKIEAGDVITAVNGEKIDGMPALFSELSKYQPGDEISLSVTRIATATTKAENFEVTITLIADNGETQK